MAYMDFSAFAETRTLQADDRTDHARWAIGSLEMSAVGVGLIDGLYSLDTPGRLRRALTTLFGLHTTPVLANPRLEAIRKLTVAARLGSADQVETMIAAVKGFGLGRDLIQYVLSRFDRTYVAA